MIDILKCLTVMAFLAMTASHGVEVEAAEIAPRPEKRLHHASKAGSWYPGDPKKLTQYLDTLLKNSVTVPKTPESAPIRAIVVPHAAYPFSGGVAAEAFKRVKGKKFKRVVVLGPAHTVMFAGLSVPDVTHDETPLGEIPLDLDAIKTLLSSSTIHKIPKAHEYEHSIEMVLPLLQRTLAPDWQLLPILVGHLGREGFRRAAETLRPLLDEETLLVISGDFTHYGRNFNYQPFANDEKIADKLRDLDMGAVEQIFTGDPDKFIAYYNKTGITACAFGPVTLLMHFLGSQTGHEMVRYETSGGQSGDYSHSVSYVALLFTDLHALNTVAKATRAQQVTHASNTSGLRPEDMVLLHKMARRALFLATNHSLKTASTEALVKAIVKAVVEENVIPDHLRKPSGAFVTLKKKGALRGCIGFIEPIKPLYQAVIENAVNAALRDFRFRSVTSNELVGLDVEVSVLSSMESVDSHNSFEVGRHGVVLSKGGQHAVFLPEVAIEQGWNKEQTLSQLSRKAGLPQDAWKEGSQFEVFTSQKYTAPYSGMIVPQPHHQ